MHTYSIRCAHLDEVFALNELIQYSSNELGKGFYTAEETTSLNQYVFGVDQELIQDKTYFVIDINGMRAACGGWSKRRTLFGGDQSDSRISGFLDPYCDDAKIRAFFIHPRFARQGLGSALLAHCETVALAYGFTGIELMSTLPGVPFYSQHGFIAKDMFHLLLPNGISVKLLPMSKSLINQH